MGPRGLEWLFGFKTNGESGNRQGYEIFRWVLRHARACPGHDDGDGYSISRCSLLPSSPCGRRWKRARRSLQTEIRTLVAGS